MPKPAYCLFVQTNNTNKKNEFAGKSTIEEIQLRFDREVERFSNLAAGQQATIDAPLSLALISEAASAVTPHASSLLDVGCGAGNYSLKILERLPNLDVTLVDLSKPMLDRAVERVSRATAGKVTAIQSDIRELAISGGSVDVICGATVLHHLRETMEWRHVFTKFHHALRPGGSLWISDLIEHSSAEVQSLMWNRYGNFLKNLRDEQYRDEVFAYINKEDSPRPLLFQLDLLREAGFGAVDVLHKNSCFAAFGGVKNS